MSAKKKITTDATKAKLPLPKGHPQRKPAKKRKPTLMQAMNDDLAHALADAKRLRQNKVDALVRAATTPSPIGGQPLPADIGSHPAPDFRAIPCGEDGLWGVDMATGTDTSVVFAYAWGTEPVRVPPPDTSPYPWPLKFAWWLDGWLAKIAQRLA